MASAAGGGLVAGFFALFFSSMSRARLRSTSGGRVGWIQSPHPGVRVGFVRFCYRRAAVPLCTALRVIAKSSLAVFSKDKNPLQSLSFKLYGLKGCLEVLVGL